MRLLQNARADIGIVEYGIDGEAVARHDARQWLRASSVRTRRTGTTFGVDSSFGRVTVHAPALDLLNVSNLLAVPGAPLTVSILWPDTITHLEKS